MPSMNSSEGHCATDSWDLALLDPGRSNDGEHWLRTWEGAQPDWVMVVVVVWERWLARL